MKVLSVSTNSELRRLRHFVLESGRIRSSLSRTETQAEAAYIVSAPADIDVLVICHTIARESARELSEHFKQPHPDVGFVVLTRTDWESAPVDSDMRLAASDGPEKLIEMVRRLENRLEP